MSMSLVTLVEIRKVRRLQLRLHQDGNLENVTAGNSEHWVRPIDSIRLSAITGVKFAWTAIASYMPIYSRRLRGRAGCLTGSHSEIDPLCRAEGYGFARDVGVREQREHM